MASFLNARDIALQATSPRTLPVVLPSTYSTSGDHTGTLSGSGQTNFQNSQISFTGTGSLLGAGGGSLSTLNSIGGNYLGNWEGVSRTPHRNDQITMSSSGALQGAGGGVVTALPYSNTTGGPPTDADITEQVLESAATAISINSGNLFQIFGSGSAGVFIGSGGLFGRNTGGGTTFSIDANSGAANYAGDIQGGSNVNILGQAIFNGSSSGGGNTAAVNCNASRNTGIGLVAYCPGSGIAVRGVGDSGVGVWGSSSSSFSGVTAQNTGGGSALSVQGTMSITSSAQIPNLFATSAQNAANATNASNVPGSGVSGTVNSATNASNATNATNASNANSLGGVDDSGWCRGVACDVGTATASAFGFGFISTVAGVETAATGGNNYRVRSISDRRTKFDIEDATLGFDFLHDLRPRKGRYKKQPDDDAHFLISQEVKETLDKHGMGRNLLSTVDETDGMRGVDYTSVLIIVLKNLCDAEKRIVNLETQLKGKIK
ncbi:tail fiber domain-containing protein [uncultured Paraglaciecola sp.]|uniref:tail fiber domain-containing protein n=1 Tax=uncultured Paraglaciecola sp. TaxID=1765024 RepID=UPI002611E51E|nr:tail fiber domain-containing protein [uncultured Paraglaciecola sp.]